ncbi:HPr family phosphocarrier protein [Buchnera aphidicola]|uniref:HPr family phosphocarrier protein n=1 Tax=Buchnera aphidicola TaxID=9 RepID=UPI00346388FA
MFQQNIKISSKHGLHTRPAAKFVKSAQKFFSEINITAHGKSANAKSLFKLQTLELSKGTIINISATGKDEKEAVSCLVNIITSLE